MTSASKYSIWNYSREGGLVQQNWGGIQSTVSELNGTPLKRALFCTGWASIVNTSFSCLTRFPSNRKTEMRPCKKKKKKSPKGLQTILDPPCTARGPAKVKITSDVSASSLDITKPVQTWCPHAVQRASEHNLAPVPGLQAYQTKQEKGERWLSFLIIPQGSDTVTWARANGGEWF